MAAANHPSASAPPPDHEWLMFQDCPDDELSACLIYEYARDSKRVVKWGSQIKKAQDAGEAEHRDARLEVLTEAKELAKRSAEMTSDPQAFWLADNQTAFVGECIRCRWYRMIPWLGIQKSERKKLSAHFFNLENRGSLGGEFQMRGKFTSSGDPPMLMRPTEDLSPESIVCFDYVCSLDWSLSNARLLAQFKSWLESNEPPDRQVEGGKGSTSARDLLKALAAYRLLVKMTAREASDFTQRKLGKPLFADDATWSRARKKAACFLHLTFGEKL